ncbi:MAG TPA: ribosomal protein S18-alanine N-acetyltransferase [Pseudolysinimonas sp.]
MTWHVRRATAGDLEALMTLENEIYPDDAWSADNMARELTGLHTYYLVATGDDGEIDGYAGLMAPLGTGQGDIQTVTVAPRARRQGLARTLLKQLIDEARRRGAEELFLEVRADNEGAQALYTELGFEAISVRKGYYGGGIDALSMKLTLPRARP